MTTLRKAAQQALGVLGRIDQADNDCDFLNPSQRYELDAAMASLRAALAQPEPEPVLYKWAALFEDPNNDWQAGYEHARRWVLEVGLQSIATPPQRKPLTDDEIDAFPWGPQHGSPVSFDEGLRDFARAIERAHGIGV